MDEWKYGQMRGWWLNEGSTDEENSAALTLCKVTATAQFMWFPPVPEWPFSLMKGFSQKLCALFQSTEKWGNPMRETLSTIESRGISEDIQFTFRLYKVITMRNIYSGFPCTYPRSPSHVQQGPHL